ncbi:DUF3052 family protein [Streptomyces sp. NPDC004435]|uniref:DUF3052 family protein n=1 Tax=Streptomyces sp. NPDC004435 TaxID=3364701 RepID=UPI0036C6026C
MSVELAGGEAESAVPDHAERMGLRAGQSVREVGWDDDTDPAIRDDVRRATGTELLDEDVEVSVDVVLYWWRLGDGDLASQLVHGVGPLTGDGAVWVLTPGAGRPGHTSAEEIAEAADDAGRYRMAGADLGAWDGHLIGRRAAEA